jgi:hypothetical protein
MSKSTRKSRSGSVLHLTSAAQERAMQRLVQRGPITIVFVYSTTCPHCHTYMPLWRSLCRTKGKANMVSMEASTYDGTAMSETKPIESVPTVLFVDPAGRISEAKSPRNSAVMMNARKEGVPEETAAANKKTNSVPVVDDLSEMLLSEPTVNPEEVPAPLSTPSTIIPGTEVHENTLSPIPGTPLVSQSGGNLNGNRQSGGNNVAPAGNYITQSGGNPWSAFLMAARQAAPAAVLLGAYAGLRHKPTRSSGLGPAKTRKQKQKQKQKQRR